MKVYCSHSIKIFTKASNYNTCRLCLSGWYKNDPTPIIIIGYTDSYGVDENYLENSKKKDLSLKQFVRCKICKDLLEKRKHIFCVIKAWYQRTKKRHQEVFENIFNVVKGFRK